MLLAAIWFSKEKPLMNVFLRPITDEINEIYSKGSQFVSFILICSYHDSYAGIDMTPGGKEKCHAILLQCSADLPGRAIVTNTKQFNGKWGCFYCTNPGMTDGINHLHRYWPHQPSVLRTNTSLRHDAADAVREGDAVRFDEHFS